MHMFNQNDNVHVTLRLSKCERHQGVSTSVFESLRLTHTASHVINKKRKANNE